MKPLFKHGLALLAVFGTAGAVLWQRGEVLALQEEHAQLLTLQNEAASLTAQTQALEQARQLLPEVEKLKAANRDLPALRNQVRQWREVGSEMAKLRADIPRLEAALKAPVTAPKSITEMEGFVARESWTHGKFDTPEAALQSLFWAMGERNFDVFLTCLTPEEKEGMERQRIASGGDPAKLMEDGPAKFKGYRIVSKQDTGDGKVVLSVQVAAGGESLKVPLQRVGQEWKFPGF
jgi:hypothetical protein